MVGFCCGKENNSSRRVILKIELRIKQPKLNLFTVSRDSSFASPPGATKGMPWLSHSFRCLQGGFYYCGFEKIGIDHLIDPRQLKPAVCLPVHA